MALVVAPLALALVLAPASPRLAVRHSARVLTPRCAEEEPQRTYRVTVPGQSSELYAFRQKAEVEEPKFKYNKKTHWLVDIPSWSPVWPERHFEFDHSLHLRRRAVLPFGGLDPLDAPLAYCHGGIGARDCSRQ